MDRRTLAGVIRNTLVDPNRIGRGDGTDWSFDLFDDFNGADGHEVTFDSARLRDGTLHGTDLESVFVGRGPTAKYVLGLHLLVALGEPGITENGSAELRTEALLYALGGGESSEVSRLANAYSEFTILECRHIADTLRYLTTSDIEDIRRLAERALLLFWDNFPEVPGE